MARSLAAALLVLALSACGGGSGGGGTPPPTGTNVAAVIVDAGPGGTSANLPFVTVTVCVPGTSTCQTIDHVLLDTGSTGMRIIYEGLGTSPISLPQAQSLAGNPLDECFQFADGFTWGSVRTADVQVADGTALNVPIQLVGDPLVPGIPLDCPNGGPPENTVVAFGANGVLGVSVFREDCGSACATIANPGGSGAYYDCPASGCIGSTLAQAAQVQNPVYHFATNNNGVAVEMPTISSAGQLSARGSLILGIGTQTNNQLGAATVLTVGTSGEFTTAYKGTTLTYSFIDSGSNAYFFNDSAMPACVTNVGFYCPARTTLSAVNTGKNGTVSNVSFDVADADALTRNNPTFSALPNIAGTNTLPSSFDWGLPFLYGRRVYVAIEGQSTSAGLGPYVAY
ncbi:MAG TPA: DUF3443 domain-containing protein [Steroidobacteraceae bacterium]|nr:DUF3443 domain-containing protein [Steroidobacteraceae bacterium]